MCAERKRIGKDKIESDGEREKIRMKMTDEK